jgi:hypothetical protein
MTFDAESIKEMRAQQKRAEERLKSLSFFGKVKLKMKTAFTKSEVQKLKEDRFDTEELHERPIEYEGSKHIKRRAMDPFFFSLITFVIVIWPTGLFFSRNFSNAWLTPKYMTEDEEITFDHPVRRN